MRRKRTSPDDLRYVSPLGLALGGGGVLGAAHVGVLQVLHERGIEPGIVTGTSAGAAIGAAYAAQIDPYQLAEYVVRARWENFGTVALKPGVGVLESAGLRRTIEMLGGDRLIENLPVRYGAVATDIRTRESVLLESGSLADAVAASIAVPGLFRPSRNDGKILVDGGLVQNLPLEAAFGMGAQHVIGVRLAPEWDLLPQFRTSVEVHEWELRDDVTIIHPKVGEHSQWVPRDTAELIELGRVAAEQALADYPVIAPRAPRSTAQPHSPSGTPQAPSPTSHTPSS
jgi:NTE family protein